MESKIETTQQIRVVAIGFFSTFLCYCAVILLTAVVLAIVLEDVERFIESTSFTTLLWALTSPAIAFGGYLTARNATERPLALALLMGFIIGSIGSFSQDTQYSILQSMPYYVTSMVSSSIGASIFLLRRPRN